MANYYPSPDFSAASLSVTGTGHIGGDFDVATNKFTVASATGNTAVAGTLGVTGAATLSSTASVVGDFSVNTSKFTVAASSGNTVVAGTLGITGAATFSSTVATGALTVTGAATVSTTLAVSGALNANGGITASGQQLYALLSPNALTTDTSDWSPNTGVNAPVIRFSATSAVNLYSLGSGVATQGFWLLNVGTTNTITLVHDDGSHGTAILRFLCPNSANYLLYKNSAVWVWYDSTSSRFRVMGAQDVTGVL